MSVTILTIRRLQAGLIAVSLCSALSVAGAGDVPCPGDLDGNGNVGPFDLAFLLGFWGPNPGHPADLDGDGVVGPFDLALLLGSWGPCPECLDAGDCQDGDPCTVDSCEFVDQSWVCINVPIVPCCGNGIVEEGEECDPPDGVNCDDNCQLIGACPGPGDCCTANGTPGCEDEECCNAVCAGDPFCCDTVWDGFCAEAAHVICGFCVSDCCIPHPTPGCDDFTCEDAVCFIDPFCCSSAWDQTCVEWALLFCPNLCGP